MAVLFFIRQAGALLPKSSQAFRTISEVADDLDIQKHVLRFWESKFAQLRPMKRGGGRRYYRPEDVELLRGIHHLLRSQAYTIKGVQRILREQGAEFVKACWQGGARAAAPRGSELAGAEPGANPRKKRLAGRSSQIDAPVAAKGRNSLSDEPPSVSKGGRLSPESVTSVQSVITQLENARQSLSKTRPTSRPDTARSAKAAGKAATKAGSKRT